MARKSRERKADKEERGNRKGRRAAGGGEKPSYRQKIRAKKLAKGSKSGCAPKLGMLLLPFAVAGALFILRP